MLFDHSILGLLTTLVGGSEYDFSCYVFWPWKHSDYNALSCIAVQNHEDLILGKNLNFYRYFLVYL